MKNKENGITLIALIITIIVMLILVGVTVNVALNGGIFNNAKEAQTKTQIASEKELLLSAITGTLNSNGDLDISKENLENQLGQNWTVANDGAMLKCKNNTTNNEYFVNKATGKIQEKDEISLLDDNYSSLEEGDVVNIKINNGELFVYDDDEGDFEKITDCTVTSDYLIQGDNRAPASFIVLKDENNNIINKIYICYSLDEPFSFTCVTTNQDAGTTHLTEGKYYLNGDSANTNDYIQIDKGEFYDEYTIVIDGTQIENFAYGDNSLAGICIDGNIYNRDGRLIGTYNQSTNTITYEENNYTIPSL